MRLSVVMAVYNGEATLAATLESILTQTFSEFELLVVDDGSTDRTAAILRDVRDPRLRVLAQDNTGLTRALIRGCAEARGEAIARHDAGDRSLPRRFERQLALLDGGAVLAACASRFVDPDGDTLYVTRGDGEEIRRSLLEHDASRVHGIVHGSAMFRRDAYLAAGGYRAEFRLAQDLDLWIRLAARGPVAVTEEVLYESRFDEKSISAGGRDAQLRLTALAVKLRDGGDEAALLAEAAKVTAPRRTKRGEAAALYFMGKCLLRERNTKGRRYLAEAVKRDPLHWRAWASLLLRR
ncbi:MAG TPA: glycosyltransferase family 2 protein [Thermoanaerobaculia bacterium]|jgi:glycosyltransferase involved in cell wall biosynthesis